MRQFTKSVLSTVVTVVALTGGISVSQNAIAEGASDIEEGKKISFHRKKGNCLACHKIKGGTLAGNIGPELVNMKARYPDKSKLRSQIWDATANNPNTIMPPFGKHKIISEKELDKVVEFIYTL